MKRTPGIGEWEKCIPIGGKESKGTGGNLIEREKGWFLSTDSSMGEIYLVDASVMIDANTDLINILGSR